MNQARAFSLSVLLLAACGSRTSLDPGPPAFDGAVDAVGGVPGAGSAGSGGAPLDGGSGGTGARPTGSGASASGGESGAPMGGSGGRPPTVPVEFCEPDFGPADFVDIWAGPAAFYVLFAGRGGTRIWAHPRGDGAWTVVWEQAAGYFGTPALTGFPAENALVLTNINSCGIEFLSGGALSCSADIAPVFDLHVHSATDAHAISGNSVLHYDGLAWNVTMNLPSTSAYEYATSVWGDDSTVLVAALNGGGWGVLYAARDGAQTLQAELYLQEEFADAVGRGDFEWTITRSGTVFRNAGIGWAEFAQLGPGCSSYRQIRANRTDLYARTTHRIVRVRAGFGESLLDLACDGPEAIAAFSGREKEDDYFYVGDDLYVALFDSSPEFVACGGVRILSGDAAGWTTR